MEENEQRNLIPRPDVTTPLLAWVTKLRGGKPISEVWRKKWHIHTYVIPRVIRGFWFLFNRKMLRRYAFTFACLATLLALAYVIEDWRGKSAWEKYKKEMVGKGAVYDWGTFIATNQHQLVKSESEEVKFAKKQLQLPPPGKLRFESGPIRQMASIWLFPPHEQGVWDKLPKHGTNEVNLEKLTALGGKSEPIDLKKLQDLTLRQAIIFLAEKSGLPLDAETAKIANIDTYWLSEEIMPALKDRESLALLTILLKTQGLQLVPSKISDGQFQIKDDVSRETLLAWYDLNQPLMDKFAAGFRSPDFRLSMDAVDPGRNGEPNISATFSRSQFLCLAAKLEIHRERPDQGLMYMERIMDMTRAVSEKGSSMGAWGGPVGMHFYLEALCEGLRKEVFSPAQLRQLRADMLQVNLLAYYRRFLLEDQRLKNTYAVEHYTRGELLDLYGKNIHYPDGSFRWFDFYLRILPRGRMYRNLLRMDQSLERFLPTLDGHRRVVDSAAMDLHNRVEKERMEKQTLLNADLLFISVPFWFTRSSQTMSLYQSKLHQAVIACALEEYRLETGIYPLKLIDLSPKYLDEIPVDVIDGQPMRYLRETENSFRLYSVGWNRKDEGGAMDFSGYPDAVRKLGWIYYSGYFPGVPNGASVEGDWVLASSPTIAP